MLAVWALFSELTHAVLKLSSDMPQELMATIERFIFLLDVQTSTYSEIDTGRRKLQYLQRGTIYYQPLNRLPEEQICVGGMSIASVVNSHSSCRSLLIVPLPSPLVAPTV